MSLRMELDVETMKLNYLKLEQQLLKEGKPYGEVVKIYKTFNMLKVPEYQEYRKAQNDNAGQPQQQQNSDDNVDETETLDDEDVQRIISLNKRKEYKPKKNIKGHKLRDRTTIQKIEYFNEEN